MTLVTLQSLTVQLHEKLEMFLMRGEVEDDVELRPCLTCHLPLLSLRRTASPGAAGGVSSPAAAR